MGGLERAPQAPRRSSRPGGAVALLDVALTPGPRKGLQAPALVAPRPSRRAPRCRTYPGAPNGPPKPPGARRAPAEPWRSSMSHLPRGPERASKPRRSSRPGGAVALLDVALTPGPRTGLQAPALVAGWEN